MTDIYETLAQASIVLDGQNVLDPRKPDFSHYYVERRDRNRIIIREAIAAIQNKRPFHWFFTGHTGAGKSTELNRLMNDEGLQQQYLPLLINISDEFDINNIEHTDIIFAMGKACAEAADRLKCKVPKELKERIAAWGKDIIREEDVHTETEGTGGLSVSLPFLSLGEEIKSGGAKRTKIRERMYDDITGFIHLLDDLTRTLEKSTDRMPLCILDGLDHVDVKPCRSLFNDHFVTLTKPRLAKLFVVPLSILNDREFAANTDTMHSTLPNIPVYEQAGGVDEQGISERGLAFYREVISRYVKLELFSDDALKSLFVLSGGIPRDMIRHTGDAAGYAADENAQRVEMSHVNQIWYEMMRYFRRVLKKADYEVLKALRDDPYPQGLDNIPPLLHLKAVIFYDNGEGWYGVHPAIQRILDGK